MSLTPGEFPILAINLSPTNSVVASGTALDIEVLASDVDGMLTNVSIFSGTTNLLSSFAVPPYTMRLENLPAGRLTLFALATDNHGFVAASASKTITVAATNDEFAMRTPLGTNAGPFAVSLAGTTLQADEPFAASWWSWTAPSDGDYMAFAPQNPASGRLAIYAVSNSSRVLLAASTSSESLPRLAFHAYAGAEYALAAGRSSGEVAGEATILIVPGAINDHFVNRIALTDSTGTVTGKVVTASIETGEPKHGSTTVFNSTWSSTWWSWTAPHDGVWVGRITSPFSTRVDAYAGNGLASLQQIGKQQSASGGPAEFIVPITNGVAYAFSLATSASYGFAQIDAESVLDYRFYPPPTNDHFAASTLLVGTSNLVATHNYAATTETNDPGPMSSLWWKWVAPRTGPVLLRAHGHERDVRVFTGSNLAALTLVNSYTWPPPYGEVVDATFSATAGQTYRIAIGGQRQEEFTFSLMAEPPANDSFTNRSVLSGELPLTFSGNATMASFESGESLLGWSNPRSLWWIWTPTETREVSVISSPVGAQYPKIFAFTGSALNQLMPVLPSAEGTLTFVAQAGVPYQIAVAGAPNPPNADFEVSIVPNISPLVTILSPTNGQVFTVTDSVPVIIESHDADGAISDLSFGYERLTPGQSHGTYSFLVNDLPAGLTTLSATATDNLGAIKRAAPIVIRVAPANDDLANAQLIRANQASGNVTGAGTEFGEPIHGSQARGHSVWWKWIAPSDGTWTVDTANSDFDTALAVYTGDSVTNLSLVASNDNHSSNEVRSKASFIASAGTTYLFAIDTSDGNVGEVELHIAIAPSNDAFGDAAPLVLNSIVEASIAGATAEVDEPSHVGIPAQHSLWWKWTAPRDGEFCLTSAFSDLDVRAAIYTGTGLSNLVMVAGDDDGGPHNTSVIQFSAVAGQSYFVAFDGHDSTLGIIRFTLVPADGAFVPSVTGAPKQFSLAGLIGRTVRIEASSNLVDWTLVQRQMNNTGWMEVEDVDSVTMPMRFYRAVPE